QLGLGRAAYCLVCLSPYCLSRSIVTGFPTAPASPPDSSSTWLCIPSLTEAATYSALPARGLLPENAIRPARQRAVIPSRTRIPRCSPRLQRGCAGVCLLHRRQVRCRPLLAARFLPPLYLSLRSLCPARECTIRASR